MTPVIDGVEQTQEGIRCKPFVYSGNTLLSMTDSENKVQNEIARVKVLKGGHTSGWVKVLVGIDDKLYLDYPITRLKNVGLATACKLHELNVRLITDLRDYEKRQSPSLTENPISVIQGNT